MGHMNQYCLIAWLVLLSVVACDHVEDAEPIGDDDSDERFYEPIGYFVGDHVELDEVDSVNRFVPANSQIQRILDDHENTYSDTERINKGVTHAYVTPWNRNGYEWVKSAARKLTHISPVWFNVGLRLADGSCECSINGLDNLDREWLGDIRKQNSQISILPRFLFEIDVSKESGVKAVQCFLTEKAAQRRCAQKIVDFSTEHGFDGVVLEIWLQIAAYLRRTEPLEAFIEEFSGVAHAANLQVILPSPTLLNYKRQEMGVIDSFVVRRLASSVDLVQVMTYDYHDPENSETPVSPIDWAVDNMRHLVDAGVPPSKLLMGANFYGFRHGPGAGHVFGHDFIKYLEDPTATLEFDRKFKDFRLIFRYRPEIVYYPVGGTLKYRLEQCEKLSLAGISIWEAGQGLNHFARFL